MRLRGTSDTVQSHIDSNQTHPALVGKRSGREVRVRVPSIDMPELQRGAECGIEWNPARVHVIAAERPTS